MSNESHRPEGMNEVLDAYYGIVRVMVWRNKDWKDVMGMRYLPYDRKKATEDSRE